MANFGRKLSGTQDILPGYRLAKVKIEDPEVIAESGEEIHNILFPTEDNADQVPGMVFDISLQELQRADAYEVSAYKRVAVKLISGIQAWAYVAAQDQ